MVLWRQRSFTDVLETRFSGGNGELFSAWDVVLWRRRRIVHCLRRVNAEWWIVEFVLWIQRWLESVDGGSLKTKVSWRWREAWFSGSNSDVWIAWDCSLKASMNRSLLEIGFSEGNCGRWFVKKEVFLLLGFVRCTETVKFSYLFSTLNKYSVSLCSDT
jgi:hypothetical protein